MGLVKQVDITNRTYYFYSDIIDLKNFESNLLKIDKESYKDIGIYNIGYITIKKIDDCEKIYSVNHLCLIITHANGYIEEKVVNKYLVFDSTDENKELLKNTVMFGMECLDNLPLNKPLKFHNITITVRSVFEEDAKLYPQVFLDDTLYELNV